MEEIIEMDLFPELGENEILHLFAVIKQRNISQITIVPVIHPYLRYEVGLEQYIKTLNTMTKNEKLHKIVEFLSTSYSPEKQSFESGEIANAFIPELSIYEVNDLCEILIANEDVRDVSTSQSFQKSMMEVLVITRTHNAYHNKRYLEEDKDFSVPIYQNISARNVIVGNVSGTAIHEDNSTTTINDKEKQKWLNILYWIIGALVGLTILYTFIKGLV